MLLVVMIGMSIGGCVQLTKNDVFPVPAKQIDRSAGAMGDRSSGEISVVPAAAAERQIKVYLLSVPKPSGVLLFLGGSGNDTEAQLRILGPAVASLGLNLMVFSYYIKGESVPTVTEVRAIARSVYKAAVCDQGDPARRVFVMGHSVGAWLALDLAASVPVAGLELVGAETTAVEDIRATLSWARLAGIRANADVAQLDSRLYAPHVTVRTLVVTSEKDRDVPAAGVVGVSSRPGERQSYHAP